MEKKEFDERLILEVEGNPCLYNKADRLYSDRNKKEQVWQYLSHVLNTDVAQCKDRWKNLRDTFSKCYKKEKNIASGSSACSKKPWPYFEIMKFLIPNIEVPKTIGNMEYATETLEIEEVENHDPSTSWKRTWSEEDDNQTRPNKRNRISDTDKVLAALGQLNEPETSPLEKFFLSLAQRASSWSRKSQSKLEMATLSVFHQIEFEDELFES